jgi:predicted nucleic acid-binding Zn ribbon protein
LSDAGPPNDDGKFAAEQRRSRVIMVVALVILAVVIVSVFISMRSSVGS